jgi:tetratricopeptide (TPR) repeat protein
MHRIAETGITVLPVVSRTNVRELKGAISVPDIMAAYAMGKGHETVAASPAHGGRPLVWLIGTLVVLVGLAVVGGSLAYYYREERAGRAQVFYKRGNELAQRGVYDQAVEQYRNALSITHSSQNRLALALALLKAGHANEAGIYLKELLNSDANSGPANLGMGRVWAQREDLDNAVAFYHHAIYGSWPENAAQQRAQARIELVQLLAKEGRTQQARAELLSAAAALPPDAATRKQVARMLMDFGLDREAADIYRDLTKRDPRDEEAYLGLAQAEYALANYSSTGQALDAALNLSPDDIAARKLREACDEIAALDPARRGLGSTERFKRSQELLRRVVEAVEKCASPDASGMIQTARSYLALKRPRSYSEAAENETTLAEQLWTTGMKACGPPAPADTPLARVLARVMAR